MVEKDEVDMKNEKRVDSQVLTEFGGPTGVSFIMIWSHVQMVYMWLSWRFYDGALFYPSSFSEIPEFLEEIKDHLLEEAMPTWRTLGIYTAFVVFEAILGMTLPGLIVKGLPVPSENNRQLDYLVNGISAWYVTLVTIAVCHFGGFFPLTEVWDNYGSFMVVSIIFGNLVSLVVYISAFIEGKTHRIYGNHIYDFFMGAYLNPRIGNLDLKMFAEIRISWMLLFILTLAGAAHQYEAYGCITAPMAFMVLAHFLYTNACMKGEECIPTTWDIWQECDGWMLIFWNFAAVPFFYAYQSAYIASHEPKEHSVLYTVMCYALLLFAYYIWDVANSQKNKFRMQMRGTYVERHTFPQLPWGVLKNPKYLKTECGSSLLIDGLWRYGRKIHYTGDILMALSWGLICGFEHFLPYFYVIFFTLMIVHRAVRDSTRCKNKYGKDWVRYTSIVPYIFIPYVF